MTTIHTCLTFENQAEEAVNYYISIFESGKVTNMMRAGDAVISISFELFGRPFSALNGPRLPFGGGMSIFVTCDTQAEVDRYWKKLSEGGAEEQCGWVTDKFGVTWQIVPNGLGELLGNKDSVKASRALQAMLKMKKLDLPALKRAFDGQE